MRGRLQSGRGLGSRALVHRLSRAGDELGCRSLFDRFGRELHLADLGTRGHLEHRVKKRRLDDGAKAAGARLAGNRLLGDRAKRFVGHFKLNAFHGKELGKLLDERILGLCEDAHEGVFGELFESGKHRKAPDEFGDQTKPHEVACLDLAVELGKRRFLDACHLGAKADAAFEEACYLATICNHVSFVARRTEFKAQDQVIKRFNSYDNTTLYAPYEAISCKGSTTLEEITLKNRNTGETTSVKADGLFVYIGAVPALDFLKISDLVDENGFLITDMKMQTKVKNLFAIGDCRNTLLRQVVSACNDGALAATELYQDYLNTDEQ